MPLRERHTFKAGADVRYNLEREPPLPFSFRPSADSNVFGSMPRPFGQHFLRHEPAHDLVDLIDPQPDDEFLEIGPGALAITSLLARRCKAVTAIEIDRRLVDQLRGQVPHNVTIIQGDALELDYRALVPPGARLAGNLPYAISSPLLRRFLDHRDHFTDAHLMLQKEVAERVASPPGSKAYGILSVFYALWSDVVIVQRLKPGDFSPPPKVDSAVIRCRFLPGLRHPVGDLKSFESLVRLSFAQRRRTIENNLRLRYPDLKHYFKLVGISEVRRAETLTVAEFARLAEVLPAPVNIS
ncbi:MAG: ribosomal RNA small subunit methyltransferase A [Vicinamibacteria bacterium]|nr:ribosomal RNA small subunit methyltransferase A [Vicinamibacteria bacterium]